MCEGCGGKLKFGLGNDLELEGAFLGKQEGGGLKDVIVVTHNCGDIHGFLAPYWMMVRIQGNLAGRKMFV